MGDRALAPAADAAGAGPPSTIGRPYYDAGWGRWLVDLGGGHKRTATPQEVEKARRNSGPGAGRVQESKQQQRGV